jgi:hypothetical protein
MEQRQRSKLLRKKLSETPQFKAKGNDKHRILMAKKAAWPEAIDATNAL